MKPAIAQRRLSTALAVPLFGAPVFPIPPQAEGRTLALPLAIMPDQKLNTATRAPKTRLLSLAGPPIMKAEPSIQSPM